MCQLKRIEIICPFFFLQYNNSLPLGNLLGITVRFNIKIKLCWPIASYFLLYKFTLNFHLDSHKVLKMEYQNIKRKRYGWFLNPTTYLKVDIFWKWHKICTTTTIDVKEMWGIISNFVAFSEKFSFKNPPLCNNVQGKWLLTIWHANQRLESREAGAYFSVFALAISKCCHFPVFWSAVFISHPFWAKWESLVGFTYKCT